MKKLVFLYILLVSSDMTAAQDSTGTRQEVWPEVNLYYRFNQRIRLFALYSATKLRNSAYTDGGLSVYLDYFAYPIGLRKKIDPHLRDSTRGYYLWFRAGYSHSSTPSDAKNPTKENTFVTEFNARFHLPYFILLTNKNRLDWRFINGTLEPRYRTRLTFEKDMRTAYLYFTPNIYGEYYIYFNDGALNRFRLSGGIQTKITKHMEFETYYVHQFAHGSRVESLNAMGFSLKFYLNHKDIKKRFSKKNKG